MSAHGYDQKRFPLTAAQGRVLYHLERLFRSTGHGMREYRAFLAVIRRSGMNAEEVASWTVTECLYALSAMEIAAAPMAGCRDVSTGRADFMPGGRFYHLDSYAAGQVRPHDAAGVS